MKILGYVLLGALALFCILLIIAVIKAIKIKAKPSKENVPSPYTSEEEEAYAKILSDMIKVPTVSVPESEIAGKEVDISEFEALHSVMKSHFPNIFKTLDVTVLEGNLLIHWKGKSSEKPAILLMGHQDVVPAAETTWERPPFSGEIAEGKIHGRGAMDCKCTVCAEMIAVEELLAEGFIPERDVYLSYSKNEEINGGGAKKIVKYLGDKGIKLACAMDEGGAIVNGILPGMKAKCAAVGIVEKGTAHLKFTAEGKGGHSSTPPKNTPIARLSAFVCEVEKHNPFGSEFTPTLEAMCNHLAPYQIFPLRLFLGNLWLFKPVVKFLFSIASPMSKAFLQTTCVFTMSGGSQAPNVIPDNAYVVANIRPAPHQNLDECFKILCNIAEKYDVKGEIVLGQSASESVPLNSEELKYVGECINHCFPNDCFTPYLLTGGTDCREYSPLTENCLRFTPVRMSPDQLAAMHAANESIDSAAVAEGVKFYKYFIKNHK